MGMKRKLIRDLMDIAVEYVRTNKGHYQNSTDLATVFINRARTYLAEPAKRKDVPATDNMALMIAHKFVGILKREMSPQDFTEMCILNANVPPGICESHNYLDSNTVMEEAFHSLGLATGTDMDLEANPQLDEAHTAACDLWNAAWELAMPMIGGK